MTKKTIVITGASGGVGSMLALGLAKKGNHIVCIGRKASVLSELVEKINTESGEAGGSASFEILDMMDTDLVKQIGEKIKNQYGSIDVWINNVGVNNHNAIGPTWDLEVENWWNEVTFNLKTAFVGTATAINLMKANNSGYVINLGGGGVEKPKPYGSAYGAAKTAIVKFTETVSLELEQESLNIKIFAFNPGFIRNERTEKLVDSDVCKKYMPGLEHTLKHGKMSDIEDSIAVIEAMINGKVDALSGRYFFADDKNIEQIINNVEVFSNEKLNLLHVKK